MLTAGSELRGLTLRIKRRLINKIKTRGDHEQ